MKIYLVQMIIFASTKHDSVSCGEKFKLLIL